jgi:hypothetical protein
MYRIMSPVPITDWHRPLEKQNIVRPSAPGACAGSELLHKILIADTIRVEPAAPTTLVHQYRFPYVVRRSSQP